MSQDSASRPGLHPHYCNICEADWEHDDACQEGVVECCPWCFPTQDAPTAPGARLGPHFHFCPECTQNWQHQAACAAPLRVVLPDCTGCLTRAGKHATALSSEPLVSRNAVRGARLLARNVVVPAAIAAGVLVSIPLLIKAYSLVGTRQPRVVILEPHSVAVPPIPETPAREPEEQPPSVATQSGLHREGERRVAGPPPVPSAARPAPSSARIEQPSETPVASKPAAPAPPSSGSEGARVAPPPPAPTPAPAPPRDAIVETTPREGQTLPIEPRTASVPPPTVTVVPGAHSQGGATLDTLLPGPGRLASAPAPRPEARDWSSESPRWDRASISGVMRAVVDIRPSQRRELQPPPMRGFIVDELGHILTSDQRLGDAAVHEVTLADGRTLGATLVARDRLNHIAILRLARRGVPAIPLGESATLAIGERVLAVGGGAGPDRTPAAATVLATGSSTGGNLAIDLAPTVEVIGGPVLNQLGAAIGILIDAGPAAGTHRRMTFAVPIDRVKVLLRNARPRPMADLMTVPESR